MLPWPKEIASALQAKKNKKWRVQRLRIHPPQARQLVGIDAIALPLATLRPFHPPRVGHHYLVSPLGDHVLPPSRVSSYFHHYPRRGYIFLRCPQLFLPSSPKCSTDSSGLPDLLPPSPSQSVPPWNVSLSGSGGVPNLGSTSTLRPVPSRFNVKVVSFQPATTECPLAPRRIGKSRSRVRHERGVVARVERVSSVGISNADPSAWAESPLPVGRWYASERIRVSVVQ
jgi:hypothetical protein